MNIEEVRDIPEEVLQRAEILGYLPEKYLEAAKKLVEVAAKGEVTDIMSALDQILPKISDKAAEHLLRTFMRDPKSCMKVKTAIFHSREVNAWFNRNREVAMSGAIAAN